MAKERLVNTRFWRDSYVLDLAPDERLLFLWALTNPATELCGAYEAALPIIELETGISRERIVEMMAKFEAAGKMLFRDGWVVVRNYAKHQHAASPKIRIGIERSLAECPEWIRDVVGMHRVSKGIDTPSHSNSNLNSHSKGTKQGIGPAASELQTWLDAIAAVLGVKSGKDLANFTKWERVAGTAIREERDLPRFLSVIKAEQQRCAQTPQFFTPEACLKNLQISAAPSTNGNGKDKKAKAIEQCNLCDEGGLRDYYKPDGSFDRRDICDHK